MELTWTTEKSEKETVRLFLRRRGFLWDLRLWSAILSVGWLVGTIFYCFVLLDPFYSLCKCAVSALLGSGIFLVCFFLLDRMLVQAPRRAYRQRKTHKVEYRLTDDMLAFGAGETQFSSQWNNVAKKFRVDKKAICLYGKDLPFEAKCIPDWQGHGVERKELVAALKKAGLKKAMSGRLKFLIWLVASPVVLAALLTVYFYIGGIEWGDWTIPNEAELRLELHDVPDEENAYLALQALTNLYHVAEGDWDSKEISDKTFVSYYGNSFFTDGDNDEREKWVSVRSDSSSPGRAAKILADNAEFFKAFHAALSLRGYAETDKRQEDAKWKRDGRCPWTTPLPLYKPIIEFAQLVSMRAQVSLEKGDGESAVSDIGEIHALGQLVMSNNESLVGYLVGKLIDEISFRKMCDVVAMGKATDGIIERFNKVVAVSEANAPMAWERGLKAVIALQFEGVEWMCDHPDFVFSWMFNANIFDSLDPSPSLAGRMLSSWPGFAKFVFHRREMLYRQAMLGRAMLAGDDDLMEMILEEIPRNPLLPNFVGNILVHALCPTPVLAYFKENNMNRLRPRLVLASEKWRRAHGGENPPSLEALVPDYLAAVPRDPWSKSGEPMKYDASLGVAWSVGKDGKYDYREIAKDIPAAGNKASINGDTQKYAFRLDGKPIDTLAVSTSSTSTIPAKSIRVQADESQSANVEAAYASEAIPVIANLRTRIRLYQYEKDAIPCIWGGTIKDPHIETWMTQANSRYIPAYSSFSGDMPPLKPMRYERATDENAKKGHCGTLICIDDTNLMGRRSKPNHYQYLVMMNYDAPLRYYAYFLGCFGDGDGLPKGTGYAVCEIYAKDRKYNGTWKRYKSVGKTSANEEVQACFTSGTERPVGDTNPIHTFGCFVPDKASFDKLAEENGELEVIDKMKKYGWEFSVL